LNERIKAAFDDLDSASTADVDGTEQKDVTDTGVYPAYVRNGPRNGPQPD